MKKTAGELLMKEIKEYEENYEREEKKKIKIDNKYFDFANEKICPKCGKILTAKESVCGFAWEDGELAFAINCSRCKFKYESHYYDWSNKCIIYWQNHPKNKKVKCIDN